jgi:hypothetical protein
MVFPHAFVLKVLGKKYVKDVYKPHIHAQHIEAEKTILPAFQTIVEWEKERRAIVAARRFNQHRPIPDMDSRGAWKKELGHERNNPEPGRVRRRISRRLRDSSGR